MILGMSNKGNGPSNARKLDEETEDFKRKLSYKYKYKQII